MTSLEMAKKAAKLLSDKKAEDISVIKIGELSTLGDYFVVASGGSTIQVRALADEIDEKFSAEGREPKRIEGYQSCTWILMDYYDVMIHIFLEESRQFYGLDRLWGDAPRVELEGIVD